MMATREEIKEVIDAYVDDRCLYLDKDCEFRGISDYCRSDDSAYKCLMQRLDELGVVIKVDRELPKTKYCIKAKHWTEEVDKALLISTRKAQADMIVAGYAATKPLGEE